MYYDFTTILMINIYKFMKPISTEAKAEAFRYYCLGLTSHEIAKLLDCSYRTIQNFMSVEKWKEKRSKNRTNDK